MEYVNYLKHNFDISIIPSPHQDYNFLHKINALYFAAGRYLNTGSITGLKIGLNSKKIWEAELYTWKKKLTLI